MKLRKLSNSPAVVLLVFILLGVVSCSDEEQVASNVASPSDFITFLLQRTIKLIRVQRLTRKTMSRS